MLTHDFPAYVDAAADYEEIGILVRSIESGKEIATTFDVVAAINEYGQLIISIVV